MKAPIKGLAGSVWRTLTFPVRVLAPPASLATRALRAEYWVGHEETSTRPPPTVDMRGAGELQPPKEGAGPLNHRTYSVHIANPKMTPAELITAFRQTPNAFSPTSFATFDPPPEPPGLDVGDEITVRLPGPWDGPVVVADVTPTSVRLETRQGHMEAGRIEFRATEHDDHTVFTIDSIARSGDAAFDLLYHRAKIAKMVQTEMWVNVLESAVAISGGTMIGRPTVFTTTYEVANQ